MYVTGSISHTLMCNGDFSIRTFKATNAVELPNGSLSRSFSIKGNFIPNAALDLKIEGDFDTKPYISKTGRKSFTFNVSNCEEIKVAEKNSIIKYLTSLKCVGIVIATNIYAKFGDETFKILDEDIEKLKEVPGIGEKKYEIISADYLCRGSAKELYTYLYQFHVPNAKIDAIYKKFKADAIDSISKNPYFFYLRNYFSFDVAERIRRMNSLDMLSDERIQASIVQSLKIAELRGDTYLSWSDLYRDTCGLLEVLNRSKDSIKKIISRIRDNAKILEGTFLISDKVNDTAVIYRRITAEAEMGAASNVLRLAAENVPKVDYSDDIKEAEGALGINLSDEQKAAVQAALNNALSIVTGGPGTGKTAFQKVLLYVFKKRIGGDIICGAPTGRAARRMTESSGEPARTIHQILGLVAADDDVFAQSVPNDLKAGLIIIDEMSMVDIYLANKMFSAIQSGARTVCIGDVFQLPSVGCGTVLKDLIDSKVLPVTRFTKVFRQADGSIIAANAAKINNGEHDLEYGEAFTFVEKTSSEDIVEETKKWYKWALNKYGPDETTILTPFRRTTCTGVNEINPVLKSIYNPYPEKSSKDLKVDGLDLYKDDKIMFTKNVVVGEGENATMLSNGDIGYIVDINVVDNIQKVVIDFKDGRVVELMGDDLKHLVQAYATTVHKSQGSEYQCCIIIVDPKHSILLQRSILYTAVTRTKTKAVIIGSTDAMSLAINSVSEQSRNSLLQHYLRA